jgi:hypothetical protein
MMDDLVVVGFRFEDGHYLLHVNLFDDNNERVLAITDNELVYSVDPWDVELVGTRLVIRVASRDILVDIRFDPPDRISFTRGRMLYSGIELLIHPEYVLVVNTGNVMSRGTVAGCNAGLVVGRNERSVGQIGSVRRTLVGLAMVGALALAGCTNVGNPGTPLPGQPVVTTHPPCTTSPSAQGVGCGVYRPLPSTTTTVTIP